MKIIKKISYLIFSFSLGITNLIHPCPFKFTNDGKLDIVLVEHKSSPEKKYYIESGTTFEVPGAEPKAYVWLYVQDKIGSNSFEIKYALLEFECVKEGDPLPHLKYSELEKLAADDDEEENQRPGYYSLHPNFEPIYISVELFSDFELNDDFNDKFKNVPTKIVTPARIATLSGLSISAVAKLIEQGSVSLEQLKGKVPEEVIEKVKMYLEAK